VHGYSAFPDGSQGINVIVRKLVPFFIHVIKFIGKYSTKSYVAKILSRKIT
jgi:hypothetical protein